MKSCKLTAHADYMPLDYTTLILITGVPTWGAQSTDHSSIELGPQGYWLSSDANTGHLKCCSNHCSRMAEGGISCAAAKQVRGAKMLLTYVGTILASFLDKVRECLSLSPPP